MWDLIIESTDPNAQDVRRACTANKIVIGSYSLQSNRALLFAASDPISIMLRRSASCATTKWKPRTVPVKVQEFKKPA